MGRIRTKYRRKAGEPTPRAAARFMEQAAEIEAEQKARYEALPERLRAIVEHPDYLPRTAYLKHYKLRNWPLVAWVKLREIDEVRLSVFTALLRITSQRCKVGDYSLAGLRGYYLPNVKWSPRCKAKTRAGGCCRAKAVPGRTRCRFHGGYTPPRYRMADVLLTEADTAFEADPLDMESYFVRLYVLDAMERTPLAPWEKEREITQASKARYLAKKAAGYVPRKRTAIDRLKAQGFGQILADAGIV